jgi:ribosomal protein L11 methylase PrmA
MSSQILRASFRDPSGFLFTREGTLYRQVNQTYRADYDLLRASGLYEKLVARKLLIPHQEVEIEPAAPALAYKIIQPERLKFISYPYEWSFSQFKDAALTTLKIQKIALEYGMSLKDASAYNIQFHRGRPTLIDTLSFEKYAEGKPWVAYRQFCQHFLAPLSLMAYRDIRLGQLMRVYIDGVPLDLASELLPWQTKWNMPLMLHIHTHAATQKRYAATTSVKPVVTNSFNKMAMIGLVENLESAVNHLQWKLQATEWSDYYDQTNYTKPGLEHKGKIIGEYVAQIKPRSLWDFGANTGYFSKIASQQGVPTIAFDIDPDAVEKGYLENRPAKDENLLHLLLDLTNPSPSIGWHHRERESVLGRGPADAVMALALIHHLAISNNVPLEQVAEFFADAGRWLIIEFVPKEDSQVKRLLSTRQDIFPNYTFEGFEAAFRRYFNIRRVDPIQDSNRRLYLMEKL